MMQPVAEIDSFAVCVQSSLVFTERLLPFPVFSRRQPASILLGNNQARFRERIDERGVHIRPTKQNSYLLAELLPKRFGNGAGNIGQRDNFAA
jgi:hypothetical protein